MNNAIKLVLLASVPLLTACATTTTTNKNKTKELNVPNKYEYVKENSLALNVTHAAGLEWYQDSEIKLKQEQHLANGTIYSTAFNSLLLSGDTSLALSSKGSVGLGLLAAAFNSSKRDFNSEISLLSAWAPVGYASASTEIEVRNVVFNELSAAISKAATNLGVSAKPIVEYEKENDRVMLRAYSITSYKDNACTNDHDCILTLIVPTPIIVDTPSFINNGSDKSYYFYNVVDTGKEYDERLPKFHFSIGSESESDANLRVDFIDLVSKESQDWVYILNSGLIFNNPKTKGNRHHQPYYANKGEKLHFVK